MELNFDSNLQSQINNYLDSLEPDEVVNVRFQSGEAFEGPFGMIDYIFIGEAKVSIFGDDYDVEIESIFAAIDNGPKTTTDDFEELSEEQFCKKEWPDHFETLELDAYLTAIGEKEETKFAFPTDTVWKVVYYEILKKQK